MDKFKYAFIMNSRTLSPDTYVGIHENKANHYFIAGVHSMKMAEELAKELSLEGFFEIDLCGDFDEKKAEKIRLATECKADVRYAKYSSKDSARMEAMESLNEYGIILADTTLSKTEWICLKSDEMNTRVACVNSLESACSAAVKMVNGGVVFIEMCRFFNEHKAKAVIDAIKEAVPVGYCG